MSNKYKLSVIIPVYNTIQYLKKCLDSIVCQTLSDIEIIVVDDASTQDIYSFLCTTYPDIKMVYLRNKVSLRPGGARNRGLAVARGEYIAFCDSDDWVDYNAYETAIKYMDSSQAEIGMISMCREGISYSDCEINYKCHYPEICQLSSDVAIRILSCEYNNGIKIIPHCFNKIFRRTFLEKYNLKFEEKIYFQGLLFTVAAFLKANKIICIPSVCYHHYLRKSSVIQSFDKEHIYAYTECFKILKKYFCNAGVLKKYSFNYYQLCEMYLNVIISEIFTYVSDENLQKLYIRSLFKSIMQFIDVEDYLKYASAESIRRHLQPSISDPRSALI